MHARMHTIATLTAAALLALTACSSNDSTSTDTTTSSRPSASPAHTDTEPLDAEQVTKALAEAIDDAKPATVYTAATDPNKMLGRPGRYTSKADWTDQRAKPNLEDAVQLGGSVEVFEDPEGAEKRAAYIARILEDAPVLGTEYHYVKGGILLRVSGALTPEQAAEYETALEQLA